MRKFLLCLALLPAHFAFANLSDGLVAYYPFDGNADDASGNGHTGGIIQPANFTAGQFGNANGALFFSGGDIQIPDSPGLNFTGSTPMTIALWVKRESSQTTMHLIGKRHDCDTTEYQLVFDPLRGLHLIGNSFDAIVQTGPQYQLPIDAWTHIAATFDGSSAWLYINGDIVATGAGTLGPYVSDQLEIAASGSCGNTFVGALDDVRIYNRALSHSEIQQLHGTVISPPIIISSPTNQTANAGDAVNFSVSAVGTPPLSYQWKFNGQNISPGQGILGVKGANLYLISVGATNSGTYSVTVTNLAGSVTSTNASLAVKILGGNASGQINPIPLPAKQDGMSNVIVITHGYQPSFIYSNPPLSQPWIDDLTNKVMTYLKNHEKDGWQVEECLWLTNAWTFLPDTALDNAKRIGAQLGSQLASQGWQHVHLIGHSAGAALIQAMADKIKTTSNAPIVQTTFLDPYLGFDYSGRSWYGMNSDWSDDYFTLDWTDFAGNSTSGALSNSYCADVSWSDPSNLVVAYGTGQVAFSKHDWPIDFYVETITNNDPTSCVFSYGFSLSEEGGGQSQWGTHQKGNQILEICGSSKAIQNPSPPILIALINIAQAEHVLGEVGSSILGNGFSLESASFALQPSIRINSYQLASNEYTNVTAWIAVVIPVTNSINFVQLDAAFNDTNSGEGLLTAFWNTNQIGVVDEKVSENKMETYRFLLPDTATTGLYTLSFRLDSFNGTSSSVTVTNVMTGYIGITARPSVDIMLTNNFLTLEFDNITNDAYIVEASTNLADWKPVAVIASTNGSAMFNDLVATNFNKRFYRLVRP